MKFEKIIEILRNYFGKESIPNPVNYPESFLWYVNMYRHLKHDNNNR